MHALSMGILVLQIEADDPQEAISLLKRAHEMARESEDVTTMHTVHISVCVCVCVCVYMYMWCRS